MLVHCWRESRLVQPLWKTGRRFLKKTKNRYSSSTPEYLPKETKNTLEKPHTLTFIRDSLIPQSVKNLPAVQETLVSIPGWERSSGNGNGNPRLKNPMDREAWWATVHAVTELDTT